MSALTLLGLLAHVCLDLLDDLRDVLDQLILLNVARLERFRTARLQCTSNLSTEGLDIWRLTKQREDWLGSYGAGQSDGARAGRWGALRDHGAPGNGDARRLDLALRCGLRALPCVGRLSRRPRRGDLSARAAWGGHRATAASDAGLEPLDLVLLALKVRRQLRKQNTQAPALSQKNWLK